MDEREEVRMLQDAANAEARHHVDADAEISRPLGGRFDVDDAEDDPAYDTDGDERSVASAPAVGLAGLDGETELNGWQELTWPGGILYRGYWRESNMHGKGMLKSDAGIFSGDFIMHKICGTGRYDFNDGSIYIGEFHDNHFQGQVRPTPCFLVLCCCCIVSRDAAGDKPLGARRWMGPTPPRRTPLLPCAMVGPSHGVHRPRLSDKHVKMPIFNCMEIGHSCPPGARGALQLAHPKWTWGSEMRVVYQKLGVNEGNPHFRSPGQWSFSGKRAAAARP